MLVATVSILGTLGMTIERLVNAKNSFINITHNVPVSGSGSVGSESGSGSAGSENGTWEKQLYQCNQWTCTNDFVFGVIVITNLCELLATCFCC